MPVRSPATTVGSTASTYLSLNRLWHLIWIAILFAEVKDDSTPQQKDGAPADGDSVIIKPKKKKQKKKDKADKSRKHESESSSSSSESSGDSSDTSAKAKAAVAVAVEKELAKQVTRLFLACGRLSARPHYHHNQCTQ